MTITNAFRDAVENGNVIGIRIMLKDSLLVDLSFNEFEEMERIALSDVCNLYDKHDGCELLLNETMWDDNYMNGLMVDVVDNFSRERVAHLKKVVRKLRPVPATTPSTISSVQQHRENSQPKYHGSRYRSYQEQKACDQRSGLYREAKIAGGAVIGAMCLSLYAYVVAMVGVPFVTAVCVLATAFFFRKAIANQFRQNRLFMGTMYGHYFNCAICVAGGMMCPWVGMSMILVLVTDTMIFL